MLTAQEAKLATQKAKSEFFFNKTAENKEIIKKTLNFLKKEGFSYIENDIKTSIKNYRNKCDMMIIVYESEKYLTHPIALKTIKEEMQKLGYKVTTIYYSPYLSFNEHIGAIHIVLKW